MWYPPWFDSFESFFLKLELMNERLKEIQRLLDEQSQLRRGNERKQDNEARRFGIGGDRSARVRRRSN